MSFVSPKTALISLSDKSNLEELVNFLISENVKKFFQLAALTVK